MDEAISPEFQKYPYGSQEYKEVAKKLGPAWSHHCQVNDHHPQHFEDGVRGMNLIQLVASILHADTGKMACYPSSITCEVLLCKRF